MRLAAHPGETVVLRPLRAEVVVGVIVAGVSVVLAVGHLHDAFWQDEVASARIVGQPTLVDAVHRVRQTESTPPLWYLVAWGLHHAGVGIVDLRVLSLLALATACALTVVFARRIVSLPAAALAGLLVAIGSHFTQAAHELRAYALFVLVTMLFALVLDADLSHPSRTRHALLALLVAAGLLTHYFFAFTLLSALMWLSLEPRARGVRIRLGLAGLVGTALASPFLPLALHQKHQRHYWWIGRFVLRTVVDAPFRLFSSIGASRFGEILPALTVVGVCAGAIWAARRSPHGRLAAALALGPWLGASLAWWEGIDIFANRNLIETGPFFAILTAGALEAIPLRRVAVAVGCGVAAAALAGYVWSQRFPPTPYDRIAHALVAKGWRPQDPIAVVGYFFAFRSPLEWYLPTQPPLARARPTHTPCTTLFVVTAPPTAVRRIEGVASVKRLISTRGVVLLTDPLYPNPCAHPATSGLYAANYLPAAVPPPQARAPTRELAVAARYQRLARASAA